MRTTDHCLNMRWWTQLALVMIGGVMLVACHSSTEKGGSDGMQADGLAVDGGTRRDAVHDTFAPRADGKGPDACVPEPPDCTGLCGPVADRCTGEYTFCGECTAPLVCSLETHTCVAAKISCSDLGAMCGTIKNSCGKRLDCGSCPAGQECDPDTNTCVACTGATCADLGYACGMAWLGCGPRSNETDCGQCLGENQVCNPNYNLCENACTPGTKEQVCAAAKASRGVECGQTTDGCGGIVDCGECQTPGMKCGVRGVANRCDYPEIPDECKARGRSCGTLQSVCGGETLNCGSCTPPEICNSNGVCGPPCTPKTCAADFADLCGSDLDDGCNGKLGCQCSEAGKICSTKVPGVSGTCVPGKTCEDYTTGAAGQPCSNGASPDFPKGNGDNLTCNCGLNLFCVKDGKTVTGGTAGTCCQNTAPTCSVAGTCSVTNTCTGQVTNCCTSNQYCDVASNTCKPKKQCSAYTDGREGHPCSTVPAFDDGSGQLTLTCPCNEGVCVVPSGGKIGQCCVNRNVCDGTTCTVTNTCTGATINCCAGNQCCDPDTHRCKDARTCAYYTDGTQDARCSTTPFFDNDCGGKMTCRCVGGGTCIIPTGMSEGTCCINTASCSGTSACTVSNTCTGQAIQCCSSRQYCDSATTTCKDKKSCGDYTNGQSGSQCSTTPFFAEGGGALLTCGCNTGGVCIGQTASAPGSCCFNTAVCSGTCTVTNTCTGAAINCCSSTQHCEDNHCVATTCATYNANGNIDDPCSTAASSAFPRGDGTNLTCPCLTTNLRTNNRCIGSSATKAGTCQCTPDACNGRTGVFDDGCGGKIRCSG